MSTLKRTLYQQCQRNETKEMPEQYFISINMYFQKTNVNQNHLLKSYLISKEEAATSFLSIFNISLQLLIIQIHIL